jgi:hypothetical protein
MTSETKVVNRKKWVKRGKYSGQLELTDHAVKQLMLEGEDVAWDGLGNYLDEDTLQDAAVDSARNHYELSIDGVPEEHVLRECAADYIYEGMLKGLKRVKAEGRSTEINR